MNTHGTLRTDSGKCSQRRASASEYILNIQWVELAWSCANG